MVKAKRIASLDGLKGIACIVIACIYHPATIGFCHTGGAAPVNNILFDWLYGHGWVFVELFLVISGYVTFYIYNSLIDNGMTFATYIKNRSVRIYPLILASLVLTLIADMLHLKLYGTMFYGGAVDNTLLSLWLSIFGIQTFLGPQSWNFPAWAMMLFVVMWLIYYIIIVFTKKCEKPEMVRAVICILLVFLGIDMAIHNSLVLILYNGTMSRGFVSFFAGGLVYYFIKYVRKEVQRVVSLSGICLFGLFTILAKLNFQVGNESIFFGTMIFPFVLIMIFNCKVLNAFLANPVLTYVGKISFSIYLCNYPLEIFYKILQKKTGLFATGWMYFVVYIAVHIAFASIVYQLFEKRIPKWLKQKRFLNS